MESDLRDFHKSDTECIILCHISKRDNMEKNHKDSIDNFLKIYKEDASIRAILLVGSIAHGFEMPESNIYILLIVDSDEY